MDTRTLVILRGLPSSGKTSFAKMLEALVNVDSQACQSPPPFVMFAADDYFIDNETPFHFSKLGAAHERCQENVSYAMTEGVPLIAVHNTFVKKAEIMPYIDMAVANGYRYFVLSLFDGGLSDAELAARNVHGVPEWTMRNMRQKFQHDWHGKH